MSVPPRRHLPERPSLEQLRKQAREHLDTLRAADPSVNLAAAQHALAREYGFESWPKHAPKGKALYSAVIHGHYDIAKLLLERGAFPNPPVESSGDALWVSQERRPDKRMEQEVVRKVPNFCQNTDSRLKRVWPHSRSQNDRSRGFMVPARFTGEGSVYFREQ